ncbi:hypothetical protein BST20_07200 [Mycobacterium branderi]|uniref:Amine oxidase domain-containing protein n=2 Tax=Mycobacterium branderi TaxID=43348 RepID=A0AA91LZR2_9MYCO|nr:hypothetical protein BST20_07200 [Mycobacterium branderi]
MEVAMASDGQVIHADAILAGGSLAGLVAAAVLSRQGYRVIVLEETGHLGSRVGGTQVDGYWIDWGHRDGHGVGDIAFAPVFTRRAAEAVGISAPLRPFVGSCLRVHWLPDQRVTELPMESVVGTSADPVQQVRSLCTCFGVAPDRLEQVTKSILDAMMQLVGISDEEAHALIPARLADWLVRNVSEPEARRVILQQNELVPLGPNESLGRYITHLKTFAGEAGAVVIDHERVGGVQGIVTAFADVVKDNGGQILLNMKPLEVMVGDHEVQGVIALDESSLVHEFRAPIVITDYEGWRLPEFVDPDLLPAGFVEAASDLRQYSVALPSWWAGLSRLPRRRSDGEVEDHASPWQRIFRGRADVKHAYGGWFFTSAFSRNSAPPGKHLLTFWLETFSESGKPGWRSWADARADLDVAIDYLHQYYADLDECVEWSRYQYKTPPSWLSWYLKPAYRHPVKVSTIDGFYVASATAETKGSFLDIECAVGLEAAELAQQERGHLVSDAHGH